MKYTVLGLLFVAMLASAVIYDHQKQHRSMLLTCVVDGTLVYQSGPGIFRYDNGVWREGSRVYRQPEHSLCELTEAKDVR